MEGGVWGLVIIFAAFMIQVFAFGLGASIGVYNIEFLEYFDNDSVGVSLVTSLNLAFFLGSGPLVSFLMTKLSYRKVAMLGSAMVTSGVALMPLLPYIPAFCLSFGTITGIGCCLVYLPSHVLSGLYYKRYQSLATGIATSGSGLGGAIMPIVFGKLIEEYYWKYSLYVVAGMMLNLFVFSALLLPPPQESKHNETETAKTESVALLDVDNDCNTDPKSLVNKTLKNGSVKEETLESGVDIQKDEVKTHENSFRSTVIDASNKSSSTLGSHVDGMGDTSTENQNGASTASTRNVSHNKQAACEETVLMEQKSGSTLQSTEWKELRHIYLFTDFGFDVYFLSSLFWNSTAAAVMAFGPEFTHKQGISQIDSATLLTIFGFGDFVGAIVGAVIGNIWTKRRLLQYTAACISMGVSVFVIPFGHTFGEFAAILLLAGLFFGVILGLLVVVLVDLIGTRNISDGMGYIMLANGLGAFIGPLLTGYLKSVTGSYHWGFYVNGMLGMLAGVSMGLIPLANCICPKARASLVSEIEIVPSPPLNSVN